MWRRGREIAIISLLSFIKKDTSTGHIVGIGIPKGAILEFGILLRI